MSVTLLTCTPRTARSPVEWQLSVFADAARSAGVRVIELPEDWPAWDPTDLVGDCTDTRVLFSGPWRGEISHGRLDAALAAVGATRWNAWPTPRTLMDIRGWAPALAGLTPETIVAERLTLGEARAILAHLGTPAFCKGVIKSRKEHGLAACQVSDPADLVTRSTHAPVAVRRLLALRSARLAHTDFPQGCEYRVIVAGGVPLSCAHYWEGEDPFGPLSAAERTHIETLATTAAARLPGDLVAVDIGQDVEGHWWVIEVGDPQFSGFAHSPHALVWQWLTQFHHPGQEPA